MHTLIHSVAYMNHTNTAVFNRIIIFPSHAECDGGKATGVSGDPGPEGVCCCPGQSIVWGCQNSYSELKVQDCSMSLPLISSTVKDCCQRDIQEGVVGLVAMQA